MESSTVPHRVGNQKKKKKLGLDSFDKLHRVAYFVRRKQKKGVEEISLLLHHSSPFRLVDGFCPFY